MISLREVSQYELEWEESCCDREPATMKKACCKVYAAQMTTLDYLTVGDRKASCRRRSQGTRVLLLGEQLTKHQHWM